MQFKALVLIAAALQAGMVAGAAVPRGAGHHSAPAPAPAPAPATTTPCPPG